MALLRGRSGDNELSLGPRRVTEEGHPTWILISLEFTQHGVTLVSSTFSMTSDDLTELRQGLIKISEARNGQFSLTGTDEDFIFELRVLDSPGDVAVSFWFGEPYVLMKGYRFVAASAELKQFAAGLYSDQLHIERAPPSG